MARMTLDIPDTVRQRLDKLKEQSEAASITEVIRRALAIYEAALNVETSGGRVLLEAEDRSIRQLVVR